MPASIPAFVCPVSDCRKSYKRQAELNRHALKHTNLQNFVCSALGCHKAFSRKDKLVDHTRAGHDADSLFSCPKRDCGIILTKATLPLHVGDFLYLQKHRKCPMPKCKFGLANVRVQSLDLLQDHLRNEHEARGRKKFAYLLAEKGYTHDNVHVNCPVCPGEKFEHHADFYRHFLSQHIPLDAKCPLCPTKDVLNSKEKETHLIFHQKYDVEQFIDKALPTMAQAYGNAAVTAALRSCLEVPCEVRENRQTLLSLWPDFEDHPVWDDLKKCSWEARY